MLTKLNSHKNRLVTAAVERVALLGQTEAFNDLYDELKRFSELGMDLLQDDVEAAQEFTIDTLYLLDIVEEAMDPDEGESIMEEQFENMLAARAHLLSYLDLSKFEQIVTLDSSEIFEADLTAAQ